MVKVTPHQERVKRVCDYIDRHLDENLSLDGLSEIAFCSKYHFHRVFKSMVGISTMKYIQLARLKRASFRLAFEPNISIIQIAMEASFDSPEAFSRAFTRTFNQTPSQFRKQPEWQYWHSQFKFVLPTIGVSIVDVKVINFTPRKIALFQHKGATENLMESVSKFIAWRKETGLSPIASSETFGIPHSDPNETEKDLFRFDIAGTVESEIPENQYGVINGMMPGGRCAVIRHYGSHDLISQTVYALYRDWLPESGEELRDYPCFFQYLNLIPNVDECDLQTDVYLPLK